ncbi:substrate-binding domain-containing protein [Palleronia aestuarii]|nr:substrate-binding domain-containing protein [Palleronia aestuarii]
MFLSCFLIAPAAADEIRLAISAPLARSGLSAALISAMEEDTGISVRLRTVSPRRAAQLAQEGAVDAVLIDDRHLEEGLLRSGDGLRRREIMHSDFALIGPKADPAGIREAKSVRQALSAIAGRRAAFVSRGDGSQSNVRERALWSGAGLDPQADWYETVNAGMQATIEAAAEAEAYLIADRISWLRSEGRDGLAILFAEDPALRDQFTFVPVNPDTHEGVRSDLADRIEDWLVSDRAREIVETFKVEGRHVFTFDAVAQE